MRNERIHRAYDRIEPSAEAKARMKAEIAARAAERSGEKRRPVRRALLLAACVVLALSIGTVGYGAYQKWSLPEPETYDSTETGIVDVHSSETYSGDAATPTAEPLSDEALISQAVALLESLGLDDVDTASMTVSRQENLLYGREEAELLFDRSDVRTTVTYSADTGALLSISSIDYAEAPAAPVCASEAEAQALAEQYYAILPVQQGYTLTGHNEYDEQYYSYEFCRSYDDGLVNAYEMVRIGVNPVTGRLCGCNVFNFPLVDDHAPGDVPLTQAQAEKIAQDTQQVDPAHFHLVSANVEAVLPNWMFTGRGEGGSLRYSDCSRIAWVLTYEDEGGEITSQVRLNIDYYTGELLGGDMT